MSDHPSLDDGLSLWPDDFSDERCRDCGTLLSGPEAECGSICNGCDERRWRERQSARTTNAPH